MRKVSKANSTVYHFNLFERRKKTSEMPFRIGFELHSHKSSANINIPFLVRFAAYSASPKNSVTKNSYGIQHISDFRIGGYFRTGWDDYKGEFAILLPLLRIWFQCDYLSNDFRQYRKFSILVFLLKIKWNELTFRAALLGFRFSFRIAFD